MFYCSTYNLFNQFTFSEGELLSPIDSSNEGGSSPSSRLMSQEGVYQLTKDLRSFSEALTDLKAVFLDDKSKHKIFEISL